METLVIYDETGYIIAIQQGIVKKPIGVPYIFEEIPNGKQIKISDGIGVDVSSIPHRLILEDTPKNQNETIRDELEQTKQAIAELTQLVSISMI